MGKKDAALNGLTKAERKSLEQQEAALIAELEARAAESVKPKSKGKTKPEPDLTTLKRKGLKALIADKTNGELRKAAKAELKRREGITDPPVDPAVEAELEAAAAEAAKPVKPARPSKAEREAMAPKAEPGAGVAGSETHSPAAIIEAADKVLSDPNAAEAALKSARAARSKALEAMSPEELKARVQSKAEQRKALEATADSIDRADTEAVKAYNATMANLGGGHFLTSDEERDAQAARLAGGEPAAEPSKPRKAKTDEVVVEIDGEHLAVPAMDAVEAPSQVATEVATENGREFAVGTDDGFGKPSEAPQPLTLEEGRNGYKIMLLGDDGTPDPKTVRQFTRVTTYIDNLEDKTNLEKWKMRTLLEGVALSDTPDERGRIDEPVVSKVRELMHVRDTALAKAAKADRKGKLEVGELARIEAAAVKAFKDALNVMADELLELGGVHEKANRGTNLHALAELYDAEGIEPIDAKLAAGEITPTDHASIVAYGVAMDAAGIKVVASEVIIVNDGEVEPWPDANGDVPILKGTGKPRTHRVGAYAGRFDRIVLAKRPGDARASRVIADIKSGRLDYGLAKVEQQVAMYADGQAYDLETGERTPLGAVKSWGLVIHLPQGEGTCTIHVLDLARGRKANGLSAQVRAHRAAAQRLTLGPDLAKPNEPEAAS